MTTPKTGAPELVESQVDKEEDHNEGLRRIEAGASLYLVVDKDLTAPPGSCADGAQYIVAATGSGAWVGHTGDIAIAVGTNAASGWYFRDPEEGVFAFVQDENALYYRSVGDSPGTWAAYTAAAASLSLDDLTDVDITSSPTPTDGQALAFNAGLGRWVPGSFARTLDQLLDVDTSSSPAPANGNVLTYNSVLGLWIPGAPAAAGATTLDGLSDVDVTSSPTAANGQVLTYNSALGAWVPGTLAAGVTTLDGLTDVDVSSSPAPADGDVLTYNSALGLWIPGTPRIPFELEVAASDETTALTAGTSKVTFRMPCAVILEEVRASLSTAQTSGGQVTVDINEAGSTILSTKLTVDNGSRTSVGSSPGPVISDTALADNAEMTVDIDNIGDGTAKGLKVVLKGHRA